MMMCPRILSALPCFTHRELAAKLEYENNMRPWPDVFDFIGNAASVMLNEEVERVTAILAMTKSGEIVSRRT